MTVLGQIPHSNTLAISDLKNQISYSELHTLVEKKKLELIAIKPRNVVWVQCTNSLETLINYLALWEKDACLVPIDPQMGSAEIQFLNKTLPPQHFIRSADFKSSEDFTITLQNNPDILDAHLIQLSSGTTGQSKIILLSQEALIHRAKSYCKELQLTTTDRTLVTVPLSHSHGIDCLALPTLFAGGTVYLSDPATSYPFRILEWIEKNKITYFSSLPQMYDLFNQAALQKSYNLTSLRHAFCGSAALSETTAKEFNRLFHLNLKQGYGLAEIGVICANFRAEPNRYASIGQPIPSVDWKIHSDGELLVKSKSLFSGYYKDFLETQNRYQDNFLRTEDLVSVDDQNFFYISGRKNDVINVLGQKVYPKEIEERIGSLEGVSEFCITSQTDAQRGQIPVLNLVAGSSSTSKTDIESIVLKKLTGQIEDFKIPRKFVWHSHFPKSPLGKVLKSKL